MLGVVFDEQLIARIVRASRVRLGMRQVDVVRESGVSRDAVSAVENGRAGSVPLRHLARIAAACRLRLKVELVASRGDIDRIADGAHAHLVETVVRLLHENGWQVLLEAQTTHGSIDVLAFHPASRMLLVVEVKSRLTDLQQLLRALARVTVAAPAAARRHGWRPAATSALLVVGESSAQRRVVARHRTSFAATFPVRTRAMRRWLAAPDGVVRGLMFLSYAGRRDVMHHVAIRVRLPAGAVPTSHAGSRPRRRG